MIKTYGPYTNFTYLGIINIWGLYLYYSDNPKIIPIIIIFTMSGGSKYYEFDVDSELFINIEFSDRCRTKWYCGELKMIAPLSIHKYLVESIKSKISELVL